MEIVNYYRTTLTALFCRSGTCWETIMKEQEKMQSVIDCIQTALTGSGQLFRCCVIPAHAGAGETHSSIPGLSGLGIF